MRGKYILYRGVDENGKRISRQEEFHPTMYVPSSNKTDWTTLDGYYVESVKPGNIPDTREFINQYKDVKGFDIYGNTDYVCQYIAENFTEDIEPDISKIVVANIDIECESEYGFPDIADAQERVNAISVDFNGKMYVLGLGEFNLSAKDVHYQEQFAHEEDLLKAFLDLWEQESPDIITGWNVRFFDIPYLVNRITNVLGKKESKRLSPWKDYRERTITKFNRENVVYELVGISTLDYYELYQTFTLILRYLRIGNSTLPYRLNESSAFKLLTYVSDRKNSSVYMESLYNLLLANNEVNYETISTIEPNLNEIESSLPQGDVLKTNIPLSVSLIPAPPQLEVEDAQVENVEVEDGKIYLS